MLRYGITAGLMSAAFGLGLYVGGSVHVDAQRSARVLEVRRYTARPDTLVIVVIPEFVVRKWRHWLLHNQAALFVKRLLLYEPRVILSSVPFALEEA